MLYIEVHTCKVNFDVLDCFYCFVGKCTRLLLSIVPLCCTPSGRVCAFIHVVFIWILKE